MPEIDLRPDQAVTDIPCVTQPELFAGPDREYAEDRDYREKAAVNLCKTGGPNGTACPLLEWCAETTDRDDAWTVRAGRTPTDRGHKRSSAANREDRTWEDCGGWTAIGRHTKLKVTACVACSDFRRLKQKEQKARRASRKAQQQAEVAA